jgi:hypothetical protein
LFHSKKPFVKSSLKANLSWWLLHASSYICEIIDSGYIIPLYEYPPESSARNNKSALDHESFVDTTLETLLKSGVVQKRSEKPYICNPLTVASNSPTKLRLVLDLRLLNPHVSLSPMKFEDIAVASQYFRKNQLLNVFDLSSAYHHIDVDERHHTLLGFQWKGFYYNYCSLPFGLKSAGLVCSKVLRVLIKKWRAAGFKVVLYLDDGLVLSETVEASIETVIQVRKDLKDAGFQVNEGKSNWLPQTKVKWLGFLLDSKENRSKFQRRRRRKFW